MNGSSYSENTEIQLGDIVRYDNQKCRVVNIESTRPEKLYTLYNGIEIIREIPISKVELIKTNLNSHFRINCDYSDEYAGEAYEDNIYLVLSKQSNDTFFKYRLVKNSSDNYFINRINFMLFV